METFINTPAFETFCKRVGGGGQFEIYRFKDELLTNLGVKKALLSLFLGYSDLFSS